MKKSITIFVSYAHEDDHLCKELDKHLSQLKWQHLITTWHDQEITAGTAWEDEIASHLNTADVILLLISPDFMASPYCYSVEMKQAIERHERGKARVIPIILRPTDWQGAPFSKLQPLPPDAKPIQNSFQSHQDKAFLDVVKGIRKVVETLLTGEEGEGEKGMQEHLKEKKRSSRFGSSFPPYLEYPSPSHLLFYWP